MARLSYPPGDIGDWSTALPYVAALLAAQMGALMALAGEQLASLEDQRS
ncbi:MAG TPA: hypothetical protein VL334_11165 [Anaerolineae bacterium]|nr:hypothetical protein [Anaerolineae bacterium]